MEHTLIISGDTATLALKGRFTFNDKNTIGNIIKDFLPSIVHCKLDVSNLEFIDSAGLGMLILANDNISKKGGEFVLQHPQGQVKRMLELSNFAEIMSIAN